MLNCNYSMHYFEKLTLKEYFAMLMSILLFYNIYLKHKIIFQTCFSYEDAMSLLSSRQINLNPLITHHYTIEESLEAFKTAETGIGNPIKIMIHCDKDSEP